jgi:flagellar biosynthesis protein FlhG
MYRLVRVESVATLLTGFIPTRSENGRGVLRDKRKQIAYLLQRDEEYHQRYFALIKRLFPLLNHQIVRITNTLRVSGLLLRDASGKINRNAYLILLTNFVHDTVHTGLGIFVGFRFNAASRAIQEGAQRVQKLARIAPRAKAG